MMTKSEVRKKALLDRKTKDIDYISNQTIENIIKSNILENKKRVAIYYPLAYEINILGLMKYYTDIAFYLPRTKDILEFVEYKKDQLLVDGPFKTKEPLGQSIDINLLDCIIIPCVAISYDKKRIGYGKGYYDKTLENYGGIKIGICHKEFISVSCEMSNQDLILDYIF